mmetsp:Transcript_3794/g.12076  ORF Transcript_3794/g.12076 Transcript_3794/m.12076 type:complete len:318 (+) Transcript_3794:533-1486(+)
MSIACCQTVSTSATSVLSRFSTRTTYSSSKFNRIFVSSGDNEEQHTRHGSRPPVTVAQMMPKRHRRQRKPRPASTRSRHRGHWHVKRQFWSFCCRTAVLLSKSSSCKYEMVSSSPRFSATLARRTKASSSPYDQQQDGSQEWAHMEILLYRTRPSSLWCPKELYRQAETSLCSRRGSMGCSLNFRTSAMLSWRLCKIRITSSPGSSSASGTNLSRITSMDMGSNCSCDIRAAKWKVTVPRFSGCASWSFCKCSQSRGERAGRATRVGFSMKTTWPGSHASLVKRQRPFSAVLRTEARRSILVADQAVVSSEGSMTWS